MSGPFGVPPPQPQQSQGQPAAAGPDLGQILALVAAGLGLVIFFCTFSDDVSRLGLPNGVLLMLAGALLTGMTLLPKAPQFLWVAAALSVLGTLDLLVNITNTVSVAGLYVVVLIAAVLQAGAVVAALLQDIGMIHLELKPKAKPQPSPYGGQPGGWNPNSGAMPQQQYGQPQPGQFGQPQPGQAQFGQPPAAQPQGGQHAAPPEQTQHISPEQYGQPQFGQPPQFGQQQPPAAGGFGKHEATRQFQHPGTPPGGFGGPQQG